MEGNAENEDETSVMDDIMKEDSSDESNIDEKEVTRKFKFSGRYEINKISMCLVMSFLYVALNLDKSNIQLTHLIRFMYEDRISVVSWEKIVPKELRPKRLRNCLFIRKTWLKYSFMFIRYLSMQLFKTLKLGTPIVPDLVPLIDDFMQELCLPNDMKPLVYSLLYYRSFDYLDVHLHNKDFMPSYELYVMAHILCALKICFGLDDEYETKLSEAVGKINDIENHPKSYNSEPTKRLFSFQEWINFLLFRKSQLWAHTLHLGNTNYLDMNDFVAFEHQNEKPDRKKSLIDEIARDIINKLPECEVNVIPRSEFRPTTTPYMSYTRVVTEHMQDPDVKKLLSEDFSQYSIKYILEDMFLVDPDSENPRNILTGVRKQNFKELGKRFRLRKYRIKNPVFDKRNVYVKDCDNHNWMISRRPQAEHVDKTSENHSSIHDSEYITDFKENNENTINSNDFSSKTEKNNNSKANGKDNESKETNIITENNIVELSCITETDVDKFKQENKCDFIIREEDEGVNIYDDDFFDCNSKEETKEPEYIETEIPCEDNTFNVPKTSAYVPFSQVYYERRDSDESSDASLHLNAESLDRNEAIKELIIHACHKNRISIPGKYIINPKPKLYIRKNLKNIAPSGGKFIKGNANLAINGIISEYQSQVQQDILLQMSSIVQSAISDFNNDQTKIEEPMDIDQSPISDNINNDKVSENPCTEINLNDTIVEQESKDYVDVNLDDQYKLFDENSDGETNAEELLPKINPEFDERTHDVTQLYIKPVENTDVAEINLNDSLFKVIDKQIFEEENNSHFSNPASPKIEQKDPYDDIPLSTLLELNQIRIEHEKHLRLRKSNKLHTKPLIKRGVPIPDYNYWIKYYQLLEVRRMSFKDVKKTLSVSFYTVLKECSDILGYKPHVLFKNLQRVETVIKDRYVRKINISPRYMSLVPNIKIDDYY